MSAVLSVPGFYKREVTDCNKVLHGSVGGIFRTHPVTKKLLESGVDFKISTDGIVIRSPDGEKETIVESPEEMKDACLEYGYPDPFEGEIPTSDLEAILERAGLEDFPKCTGKSVKSIEKYLSDSRKLRRATGLGDKYTKALSEKVLMDSYVGKKFEIDCEGLDVFHPGFGSRRKGVSYKGLRNAGKIRACDPLFDGTSIRPLKDLPPEPLIVSDVSYTDGEGMSEVERLYIYYRRCAEKGKRVWFKANVLNPPRFGFVVVKKPRPHNKEVILYTDRELVSKEPEGLRELQKNMIRANRKRNNALFDDRAEKYIDVSYTREVWDFTPQTSFWTPKLPDKMPNNRTIFAVRNEEPLRIKDLEFYSQAPAIDASRNGTPFGLRMEVKDALSAYVYYCQDNKRFLTSSNKRGVYLRDLDMLSAYSSLNQFKYDITTLLCNTGVEIEDTEMGPRMFVRNGKGAKYL